MHGADLGVIRACRSARDHLSPTAVDFLQAPSIVGRRNEHGISLLRFSGLPPWPGPVRPRPCHLRGMRLRCQAMSRAQFMAKAAAAARDLADALARLAQEGETSTHADTYDSDHLPPRTSRRRFAEFCRSGRVAGAYREGRHWVCARESWHSARIGSRPVPGPLQSDPVLVARADEMLRRRGLRLLPPRGRSGDNDGTR
jgi:hypothetical protein